jgi:hypothetical protein
MVEPNGIDIQSYRLMLEELLDRLRQEVSLQSSMAWTGPDLDQYLLEVNTFYYRSFQQHYLPRYELRWREEVRNLLQLSQQQEVLETNIISTLKRYTRLYNLLKTLLTSLAEFRRATDREACLIQEEITRQGVELHAALTGLQHQLHSLHRFLTEAGRYLNDDELMAFLREYPGYAVALCFKGTSSIEPAMIDHQLARLISEIAYLIGVIGNPDQTDQAYWARIAEDMGQHIEHLQDAVRSGEPGRTWINPTFIDELILYKAALSECHNTADLGALIIRRLKGWHKVLQLRAAIHPELSGLRPDFIPCLIQLTAEDVQEAARDVDSACQQLDQIVASLSDNPEPSYRILVQVREWLGFWSPFLRSMSTEEDFQQVPPLNALLHEVRVGIVFLSNQMSLIETARHRSAYSQDKAERMRRLADEQLNYLGQLKNDLERLLAPRNVTRTWKDMGVRLLKLPLQKGRVFPEEYRHLLQQARIEVRTDANQPDFTILHEEGDLFLIQVLNSEQTEIPYLVITRQPDNKGVQTCSSA